MPFSKTVAVHGQIPKSETLQVLTLQKSSVAAGGQEITFTNSREQILFEFRTGAKITKAASLVLAATNFSETEYNIMEDSSIISLHFEEGKNIYVLNDLDSIVAGAANMMRYQL